MEVLREIMVDKNSRALHGRARSLLESAVLFGEFPPGQLLPSERSLAIRYQVTRTTIRRSLAKLVDDGMLVYQPYLGHKVVATIKDNHAIKGCVIGLIWNNMPSLGGLAELESQVAESGHVLMLGASGVNGANEDNTILRMASNGMAGLIITPARIGGQCRELESWIKHGKPVVFHGHAGRWLLPDDIVSKCSIIDVDNRDGTRQLLSYIAEKGHKSAAFISSEAFAGSERSDALQEMAPEFGVEIKKSWQFEGLKITPDSARELLDKLRATGDMPTVLICSHHKIGVEMRDAIKEAGLDCPRDISVIAFSHAVNKDDERLNVISHVGWSGEVEANEMLRLLAEQFSCIVKEPEHVRQPMILYKGNTVGEAKRN